MHAASGQLHNPIYLLFHASHTLEFTAARLQHRHPSLHRIYRSITSITTLLCMCIRCSTWWVTSTIIISGCMYVHIIYTKDLTTINSGELLIIIIIMECSVFPSCTCMLASSPTLYPLFNVRLHACSILLATTKQ